MNILQRLAAISTAVFSAIALPAQAQETAPQEIQAPADAKLEFAVKFPQGTVLHFKYAPNHRDTPFNRAGTFFCPQQGGDLPTACFQQRESGSDSLFRNTGLDYYRAHMVQPAPGDIPSRRYELKLEFAEGRQKMTCPAMPERGGEAAQARDFTGQVLSDAEKDRLLHSILSGATKLIALPQEDINVGVFSSPNGAFYVVTLPRDNFSTDKVGVYVGNGDFVRYPVSGYSESNGRSIRAEGLGTLQIPFDLFGEGLPARLTAPNGLVTELKRVDDQALPTDIRRTFGPLKGEAPTKPFPTPCTAGLNQRLSSAASPAPGPHG